MPLSCMMFMTSIRDSKKKKKNEDFPTYTCTYPNFLGHVTGNTHTFLFGLWSTEQGQNWSGIYD